MEDRRSLFGERRIDIVGQIAKSIGDPGWLSDFIIRPAR
jgi:hypothetical protein